LACWVRLKPDAGRHSEPLPDCSFFCDLAEQEIQNGWPEGFMEEAGQRKTVDELIADKDTLRSERDAARQLVVEYHNKYKEWDDCRYAQDLKIARLQSELDELEHKVAETAEKCGIPHTNDFDASETLNRIAGFYLDEIAHQKLIFEVHQKSVSGFLVELYAIMIDPLFDGAMSVGDITTVLLHQAKNIRERLAVCYWPCTACGAMNQVEPK
jgi:hypothetical protein